MRPSTAIIAATAVVVLLGGAAAIVRAGTAGVGAAPQAPERAGSAGGETLVRELACGVCHAGLPTPAARARALTLADEALDATTVHHALLGTDAAGIPPHVPRFPLDEREAAALALYLGGARPSGGDAGRAFRRARGQPGVSATSGAQLFTALNCGACHADARGVRSPPNGPPLALEGERVRPEWLRAFLRRPHAVRPFGLRPGSGGRMPDFGLSAEDADAIAEFLLAPSAPALPEWTPTAPSAFAGASTNAMLERQLPCLGCHTWNGSGGRIGPDLTTARARLRPAYVRAVIEDPAHFAPGTIMPRLSLQPADQDRIASHILAGADAVAPADTSGRRGYLSLLDHAVLPAEGAGAEATYLRSCAPCHGAGGAGDGFNARYLGVRPTAHADAAYLSRRPDDALFDATHAGGRIMGRSHLMPGFGGTLTSQEIRALVAHMRTLCACTQPSWAGDGSR